jgi:hypothetical protein
MVIAYAVGRGGVEWGDRGEGEQETATKNPEESRLARRRGGKWDKPKAGPALLVLSLLQCSLLRRLFERCCQAQARSGPRGSDRRQRTDERALGRVNGW